MNKSPEINAYIDNLPEAQKHALQQLRNEIRELVPEAVETISTNVPAFRYKGKYLVSFSATSNHLALLVMQGDAMKALAQELKEYNTGNRIIRFTPDKPLPRELLDRIIHYRKSEIDQK